MDTDMENMDNNNYPSLEDTASEVSRDKDTEEHVQKIDEATNTESLISSEPENLIYADDSYDSDMWQDNLQIEKEPAGSKLRSVFEFFEMLAIVTVSIILCFTFIFRLNIVEGPSMEDTLYTGEYLMVSDLLYTPKRGDIVVIQDMTAIQYTEPIVKRVIATSGQTVDIDFDTWTVTVDGEVVDESEYITLRDDALLTSDFKYPITVDEGCVFVMGDNRNHSADSRIVEIGQIDERCVVGKVYMRIAPLNRFTVFKNPTD